MMEFLKDFLTAREPGQGYFGGAEGALRSVVFGILAVFIAAVVYFV